MSTEGYSIPAQETFLQKLRIQTAPYHKSLEKAGLSAKLMDSVLTIESYKTILKCFYGFIMPAEENYYDKQIDKFAHLQDYKRGSLLRRDLLFLGLSESDVLKLPLYSEILCKNTNIAIGCIYVLEGSKLGGQTISKHVKEKLNFLSDEGTLFFNAHGHQTGPIWKAFIDSLCDYAVTNKCEDDIILGAKQTFEKFEKWITSYENLHI